MKLKRIASLYLSVCLVIILTLSSYFEASAANPVVVDTPEDSASEWDDLADLSANKVDDLAGRELHPFTPEQVEEILELEDLPSDDSDLKYQSPQISTQALVIDDAVAMILILLFSSFTSAIGISNAQNVLDEIQELADSSSSVSFYYRLNGSYQSVVLNAAMAKYLLQKLSSSHSGDTYSVELTEDDKNVLGYAFQSGVSVSSLDPETVHVVEYEDYKYYYIIDYGTIEKPEPYVLYSKNPVSLALFESGSYKLYTPSSVVADASFPYIQTDFAICSYVLSSTTGLYEFNKRFSSVISTGSSGRIGFVYSLPFAFPYYKSSDEFKSYFAVKSALLLDCSIQTRKVTIPGIFSLSNVSYSGEVSDLVSSEKNLTAAVTGLNTAAGAVIEKSDAGTDTKPGTDTGTDTKPGTDTGTISAAVAADIASIKSVVNSLQTTISAQNASIASISSDLAAIKAAVIALQQGMSVTVDNTAVLKAMEELKAEIVQVNDLIETIPASIAAQNELIDVIPGEIADTRDAVEEVKAEVAALSDVITDVITATNVVAGTVTDAKTGIKESVDALPGSIANSMIVAAEGELSAPSTDYAFTNPLNDRFQFSIPWDIAGCITLLQADPVEPVWKVPFKVENSVVHINEEFVIDLSGKDWELLRRIVRAFILIVFVAALAAVTRILIKG